MPGHDAAKSSLLQRRTHLITPILLRRIERAISATHCVVEVLTGINLREPDRHGDFRRNQLRHQWRNRNSQSFSHRSGLLQVCSRQKHHELVAPQTNREILLSRQRPKKIGKTKDDGISDFVTVRVVHRLSVAMRKYPLVAN